MTMELTSDKQLDSNSSHSQVTCVADMTIAALPPQCIGVSVGELVEWRQSDRFNLALVQRDPKWDKVRMAYLLDSLLARYPIGMLLMCSVDLQTDVLTPSNGSARISREVAANTPQLLDGQQRIYALYSIFAKAGDGKSFYLDMTCPRPNATVATRKRSKIQSLPHILWQDSDEDPFRHVDRNKCVDLSLWAKWATERSDAASMATLQREENCRQALAICHDIDPSFKLEMAAVEKSTARTIADRLHCLWTMWTTRFIPVQSVPLKSPADILQVFTRINLAGVPVSGTDVFFAAVKTLWSDAEEHLESMVRERGILDRSVALRLLARLAYWKLKEAHLVPLRVEVLNGEEGALVKDAMREMTSDHSPCKRRINRMAAILAERSQLGYGLHHVNDQLYDHLFGWAALNEHMLDTNDQWIIEQLPTIETYLAGMTMFRYAEIFRDEFARVGFRLAVEAAKANESFPATKILNACKTRWGNLKHRRSHVTAPTSDQLRMEVLNMRSDLVLCIVQRIPFIRDRHLDRDHIYAQALGRLMKLKDDKTGWPRYHHGHGLIWNIGNLWALDASTNRALHDEFPTKKLDAALWPPERFLSPTERADLLAAENALKDKRVDEGMRSFESFVTKRALRMWDYITEHFPGIDQYGSPAPTLPR